MTELEKEFWLDGEDGLKPYLRMKNKGMPHGKINQIAWLLLNGSGCGFCKVCRDEPCNIKDGEKCTENIANYIKECVISEQWIPCSERLPDHSCDCLIAWRHRGQTSAQVRKNTTAGIPHYYEIASYNVYHGWSKLRQGDDIEVIAWMPLPEPYKEPVPRYKSNFMKRFNKVN